MSSNAIPYSLKCRARREGVSGFGTVGAGTKSYIKRVLNRAARHQPLALGMDGPEVVDLGDGITGDGITLTYRNGQVIAAHCGSEYEPDMHEDCVLTDAINRAIGAGPVEKHASRMARIEQFLRDHRVEFDLGARQYGEAGAIIRRVAG